MKRWLLGLTTLALVAGMSAAANAQGNPRGKASLEVNGKKVTVDYGRPSLKGRTVQEMMDHLPADGIWRLGADTSTTFTTSGDLMFGDTKIEKGTYSLWARHESGNIWKLVFNSQHGQWGTQHDPSKDVASVATKESRSSSMPDEVTISLVKGKDGGMIAVEWGDLRLTSDFK